ncbi:MAG: stage 0 sporulation family protein [Candidatus Tectimicrobiota bacterium]
MQIEVVGLRFKPAGKILHYATNAVTLHRGEKCVAESENGLELATVVLPPRAIALDTAQHDLKPVIRKASVQDFEQAEALSQRAKEAFTLCRTRIRDVELPMKLVSVDFTLDAQKAIFYFTAADRIDFRSLVRYLAGALKVRIEMRQIGPRDETKKLGGYGVCGQPLCCTTFLSEFAPISVRMAKEQGMALNPSRISGVCGRLKCCLAYEMPVYKAIKDQLPHIGESYMTEEGRGRVVDITVVGEAFAVELEDSGKVLFVRLPSAQERTNNCHGCSNHGLTPGHDTAPETD